MSTDRAAQTAQRLFDDHRSGVALTPLPDELRPRDLEEAYRAQDRLQALLADAGAGGIAGWKIALTTPVMQQMVGVSHPCEGAIFASRVHHRAGTVRGADYQHLGVESEIAVRIGRDLGPDGAPYDRESVARAVEACMAGIEIVDDRDCVYGSLDGATLIADNSFNFGCVVGEPVTDWRKLDLAALSGRMTINGEIVGEGRGTDVMGHPFIALAWLANNLVRRGKPLRAGDIVLTGSIVATKWLKPGDEMATILDGLGEARLTVT